MHRSTQQQTALQLLQPEAVLVKHRACKLHVLEQRLGSLPRLAPHHCLHGLAHEVLHARDVITTQSA